MQIKIEISDEDYKDIIENGLCGYSSVRENVSNAIFLGKPLPKGHGDLIDRDALESHDEYDGQGFTKSVYKDDIDLAPTIIEADKAESEK